MSIESQLSTLRRTFAERTDVKILGVYEEAFSAKAPGRPLFNGMLSRIERGEADGIVAWAPDRLARNSIDGGRIVYMLDCGLIKDLKFATYTFENNSQGKFMLQIMFGQSKYYSDALSENVKRGNRTKIENGWRPNQGPLGYLNDKATKTIVRDPVHFPLIRRMYDLMLTGAYPPRRIALIARDEWGFCTPKKKRIGGTPLAVGTVHRILTNPFYAGLIVWDGHTYRGKHEPVVTIEEFQRVRQLLRRPGRPKAQKYFFAYSGMIRCGACGLFITAENKVNAYGSRYVYYHCTRSSLGSRCKEPSVELRALEQQIQERLQSLTVDPAIQAWMLEQARIDANRLANESAAERHSLEKALANVDAQLAELTGLRLRTLVTDAEFLSRRKTLQEEQFRLQERLRGDVGRNTFELFREVISFNNRAAEWFSAGDNQCKRLILQIVSSNITLKGKILSIEAAKPFNILAQSATNLGQRAIINDVRTLRSADKTWLSDLREAMTEGLNDAECRTMLTSIRLVKERFQTDTSVQEGSRPARAA